MISRLERAAAESSGCELTASGVLEALNRSKAADPREVSEALVGEGLLFRSGPDAYVPRSSFFSGGKMLIALRKEEIEQGILIPGHRFLPLYDTELSPAELTLSAEGTQLGRTGITRPVSELLVYYTLFGRQSFPIYLALESERNAELFAQDHDYAHSLAAVSVVDMRSCYAKWNLQPGDYLTATLLDWKNGSFSLAPAKADTFDLRRTEAFVASLDRGFMIQMDEISWPLPPPEELARAFFSAGREVIEEPALHVGGYLARSERIGLVEIEGDTYLWDKQSEPDDSARHLAGRLDAWLSANRLEDLTSCFDLPVPMPYIEGCIRRYLDGDFDTSYLLSHVFSGIDLDHLGDREYQQLSGALNSFIREVKERYDPQAEPERAKRVHRTAVTVYHQITQWLDEIEEYYGGFDLFGDEENSSLKELSDYALQAVEVLNVLHHSPADIDEERLSYLEEHTEDVRQNYPSAMQLVYNELRAALIRERREVRLAEEQARFYLLLEAEFESSSIPVRRSLRIPETMSLIDLHYVLQLAFGWSDAHLHSFLIAGIEYGDPDSIDEDETIEDEGIIMAEDLPELCSEFLYTYDFGDDWRIRLSIVETEDRAAVPEAEREQAVCLGGTGAAPPEDCGGVPGYEELAAAIRTPPEKRSEEQEEQLFWAGNWHPDSFSPDEINERLSEV
jgi:hypothetical protein